MKNLATYKNGVFVASLVILASSYFTLSYHSQQYKTSERSVLSSVSYVSAAICDPVLDGKYSMSERFGFGFPRQICSAHDAGANCTPDIDYFSAPVQELGTSWYSDWSSTYGGQRQGHSFIGVVGGWGAASYTQEQVDIECNNIKNAVVSRPDAFPDGMRWTVGNEIGWDDGGQTPQQYADHFVKWKSCIKSIGQSVGKNFEVGTGSLIQLNMAYPAANGDQFLNSTRCQPYNINDRANLFGLNSRYLINGYNYYSGVSYFLTYIGEIRSRYGEGSLPDFVMTHGYTPCDAAGNYSAANWKNANLFKDSMVINRATMKAAGLQNSDLLIKEMGPFPLTEDHRVYMQTVMNYLTSQKDADIGHPNDANRLVQKWAWYVFSGWPDDVFGTGQTNLHANVALVDRTNQQLTPLGQTYKSIIASTIAGESSSCLTPTSTPSLSATVVPSPTVTLTIAPTSTPHVTVTATIAPSITKTPTRTPTLSFTIVPTGPIKNGTFEGTPNALQVNATYAICDVPLTTSSLTPSGLIAGTNLYQEAVIGTKCSLGTLAPSWLRTGSTDSPTRYGVVTGISGKMQLVIADSLSSGVYQQLVLDPAKKYRIDADLFVAAGKASLKLTDSSSGNSLLSITLGPKSSWQKATLTVSANTFDTSIFRVISRTNNTIFYVDNVKITEIL